MHEIIEGHHLGFRDVEFRRFIITERHDTILSNLFSNIKGKGVHYIFDLDKEVDVRNVAGSQGKVETSLEEVKGERINGSEREVDDKFGLPITNRVEIRSGPRKREAKQGGGHRR
ncbi:hypothetical protein SUGI_0122420 [Cryptomeria japonica]|nr:hypothetical protein SUGI_0122420 [Cryptomeria japonica]